jgi:hypothetical protein
MSCHSRAPNYSSQASAFYDASHTHSREERETYEHWIQLAKDAYKSGVHKSIAKAEKVHQVRFQTKNRFMD